MFKNWVLRLYSAWHKTQTPVIMPFALICVGAVALVLGEGASKAFANLGGSVAIRVMGVLMLVGGGLIIASILKRNYYPMELAGLVIAALGAAIYGGGVVLGLHSQGLVSGIGYSGITLTLLGRVFFLLRVAKTREMAGVDVEPSSAA